MSKLKYECNIVYLKKVRKYKHYLKKIKIYKFV